jgi:hypothetical protein
VGGVLCSDGVTTGVEGVVPVLRDVLVGVVGVLVVPVDVSVGIVDVPVGVLSVPSCEVVVEPSGGRGVVSAARR